MIAAKKMLLVGARKPLEASGSFEQGMDNWVFNYNGNTASRLSNDNARTGQFLLVLPSGGTGNASRRFTPVNRRTVRYTFRVWIRRSGRTPGPVDLKVDGSTIATVTPSEDPVYSLLQGVFTRSGATDFTVSVAPQTEAGVNFDDWSITGVYV